LQGIQTAKERISCEERQALRRQALAKEVALASLSLTGQGLSVWEVTYYPFATSFEISFDSHFYSLITGASTRPSQSTEFLE
jgi:hypothetical protein